MERTEIYEKLHRIFWQIFDDDSIVLEDRTTADDIEDWTSFEQLNLITAIETEFRVRFKTAEVMKLANVGAMVDILIKKTGK